MPPEDELGGAGAGEGAGVSSVGVAARELGSLDGVAGVDSLGAATEGVVTAPLDRAGGAGGGGMSTASSGATLVRRTGSAALTFAAGRIGAASPRAALPERDTRARPKEHAKVAHASSTISSPRPPTRVPSHAGRVRRRSTPNVFTPGTRSVEGQAQRRTRRFATARHDAERRSGCTCRSRLLPSRVPRE